MLRDVVEHVHLAISLNTRRHGFLRRSQRLREASLLRPKRSQLRFLLLVVSSLFSPPGFIDLNSVATFTRPSLPRCESNSLPSRG